MTVDGVSVVSGRVFLDLTGAALRNDAASWSVGTFGAVAEFLRLPDEPVEITGTPEAVEAVTSGGGIRLSRRDGVRPLAWQRPTGRAGWNTTVALCLPASDAAGVARDVVTELGPDRSALRAPDRAAVLFDLGLGVAHLEACVRTADPSCLAALRAAVGRPFAAVAGLGARLQELSPHRVFQTRLARIEVYGRIPPPDGTSPPTPHTHLLPQLLRHRRPHAATDPIPDGWLSVANLYPAHPVHDVLGRPVPFDPDRDRAVEALLDRYGDPATRAVADTVVRAVRAGREPEPLADPASAVERAAARVALRRLAYLDCPRPVLRRWRAVLDPVSDDLDERPPSHPAEC